MEIYSFSSKSLNRKDKLEKLNRVLSFQISSFLLIIVSFFVEFALLLFAALASVFMFYLVYVLWYERKQGWIISFFIFVLGSFALKYVDTGIHLLNKTFYIVPLVAFFTYCFLLKISLPDWIKDKRWKKVREIEIQNKLELEKELKIIEEEKNQAYMASLLNENNSE